MCLSGAVRKQVRAGLAVPRQGRLDNVMERFYCPNLEVSALDEAETHHAAQVLRLEAGQFITVFDGKGREWKAKVTGTTKKRLQFQKLAEVKTPKPVHSICLAQAVTKNRSMDLILQKATELGVTEIAPLLSDRTVAKVADEKAEEKIAKWREVTIEAAKQSGQNWLPVILPPLRPREFAERAKKIPLKLIGSLQPEARPIKETVREFLGSVKSGPQPVAIMIGPEGDFTPAEIGEARASGFLPISLGPLVLRSETAAIFCLSVLRYELAGD